MLPGSLDRMFDIGPYVSGEETAILDCMQACFGRSSDMATWRHLHLENPAGEAIILLARTRGVVVSHMAIVPVRVSAFGREVLAGHSIWAMTRPEWQRMGLSRTLAVRAQETARSRGLRAIYGFANKQSFRGILKYQGRRPVRPFPLAVHPTRPGHAVLALARSKWLGSSQEDSFELASIQWTTTEWTKPAFDDRHTALFQESSGLPPIAVVRDRAYLTWRYARAPNSPYMQCELSVGNILRAVLVLREAKWFGVRFLFVMEWLWKHDRDADELMQEAIHLARSSGAAGVAALAMPGTTQRRRLRHSGFVGVPNIFLPRAITLMVRPIGGSTGDQPWLEGSNWYLTFGDGIEV